METGLKRWALVATCCLVLCIGTMAFGQQVDFAFGLGGVTATSASHAGSNYTPQSVGGGTFPSFSGNVLIKKNFGVGGEIAWRVGTNSYLPNLVGVPFRPIFYDFDGVWEPRLEKHWRWLESERKTFAPMGP